MLTPNFNTPPLLVLISNNKLVYDDLDLLFTEAAAAELAAQQAEEEAEEGRQLLHASPHCMSVFSLC